MIEVSNNAYLCPEAGTIFTIGGIADRFDMATEVLRIGDDIKIAPWGVNNDLPQQIIAKSGVNEIVGSNLLFNISTTYGVGIKALVRVAQDTYEECTDNAVLDFFEDNDVTGYFLEQVTDMMHFNAVFPQIILNGSRDRIVGLHHLEATHSRWGSINRGESEITKHYLSALWGTGKAIRTEDVQESLVLSRYNTYQDLKDKIKSTKDCRFVMQVHMPSPGRTYYPNAYWHSIFKSGWFDYSCMIPKNKIAILKNKLTIRNIVYISDRYWDGIMKREGIAESDREKRLERMNLELERIKAFMSGEDGKGGTLITSKESSPGTIGKAVEDRHIVIEPIKSELSGGELVQDSEEASNIISYAMGVHPSLNGATPGKNSGSLGGSDKETLFAMKQAMMTPFRDRLLKPLNLIKRFNGWDKNIVFAVPDFELLKTTPTKDADKRH